MGEAGSHHQAWNCPSPVWVRKTGGRDGRAPGNEPHSDSRVPQQPSGHWNCGTAGHCNVVAGSAGVLAQCRMFFAAAERRQKIAPGERSEPGDTMFGNKEPRQGRKTLFAICSVALSGLIVLLLKTPGASPGLFSFRPSGPQKQNGIGRPRPLEKRNDAESGAPYPDKKSGYPDPRAINP